LDLKDHVVCIYLILGTKIYIKIFNNQKI